MNISKTEEYEAIQWTGTNTLAVHEFVKDKKVVMYSFKQITVFLPGDRTVTSLEFTEFTSVGKRTIPSKTPAIMIYDYLAWKDETFSVIKEIDFNRNYKIEEKSE